MPKNGACPRSWLPPVAQDPRPHRAPTHSRWQPSPAITSTSLLLIHKQGLLCTCHKARTHGEAGSGVMALRASRPVAAAAAAAAAPPAPAGPRVRPAGSPGPCCISSLTAASASAASAASIDRLPHPACGRGRSRSAAACSSVSAVRCLRSWHARALPLHAPQSVLRGGHACVVL